MPTRLRYAGIRRSNLIFTKEGPDKESRGSFEWISTNQKLVLFFGSGHFPSVCLLFVVTILLFPPGILTKRLEFLFPFVNLPISWAHRQNETSSKILVSRQS
ncbi:hypothetical protein BDV59DRAFT_14818 [Aspergillus ambiguus]|uniref:uncharacterized protein n=1 Tax=Aspergillus ambiguus TaxID=176160 RepID=UPI003CCDA06E